MPYGVADEICVICVNLWLKAFISHSAPGDAGNAFAAQIAFRENVRRSHQPST